MPFCMVKGALLMCKRRPFATQKMPFYKPVCNQLKICRLQSWKSTVFFRFALHHGFKFVISFYYSPWVMFCMRIRRSIHYEYCAFILRFCIDCMGTYHALRFEYHVFYVGKLCVLRLNSAWFVSGFIMRYDLNIMYLTLEYCVVSAKILHELYRNSLCVTLWIECVVGWFCE